MLLNEKRKDTHLISRRVALASAIFAMLLALGGGTICMADGEFRQISMPARENGYSTFSSQAITTKPEFDKFIKSIEAADSFNQKELFLSALKSSKIDFGKDSLVLLRSSEGSGSTKVSLNPPQLKDKQLFCKLERKVAQMGTADMAYYCFAFVVSKAAIKELVFDNGKRIETISCTN